MRIDKIRTLRLVEDYVISRFSINLLSFLQKCCNMIGFLPATYSVIDIK